MRYRWLVVALFVGALALAAAGCGSDDDGDSAGGSEDVSGSLSIMAIWGGDEQASFQAVIDGFEELYPNVSVKYTSGGDNLAPLLSTAVEGGNPPDIAAIGQPGLMADFAAKNAIQPIDDLRDKIVDNFGESVADVGAIDGTQYGIMFKGANKSTIWYNVAALEEAGVEPPETWDDLDEAASTLKAAGVTPYAVGVDVGWPITDLFENVYIRTAGPEMYDQLTKHEIPWTDQSVKDALAKMADIVGDSDNMAGGTEESLQTEMPASVAKVFKAQPDAAMVVIGDFAPGVTETTLEPETGYNVFTFPSIDGSNPAVVGGGDIFVQFTESEAADAFMEYLTTPEAAEIWAKRGGFSSPNKNLDPDVYPDEITRATAGALGEAEVFRFDMSDLQPSAFGGTPGQGLFKAFTDFVANPDNVDQITQQMEDEANKAFG
jgi:ABC-type glycerol-3-phosphate transport system substrate-binding protein